MSDAYVNSVQAYEQAISDLYGVSTDAIRERGEGDIRTTPDLDERAQAVVERSAALGADAAENLSADAFGQRELAQLQLLAAAAIDLHLASDMVRLAEEGERLDVAERSASVPGVIRELQDVLHAAPEQGIAALIGPTVERGGPLGPPREALGRSISSALEDIKRDAAAIGGVTFNSLLQIPAPVLQNAAGLIIAEVMTRLSEGVSLLLSKAVALLGQAIDKLMAALGKDVESKARKQVAEWIEDLKTGTLFDVWIEKLYETQTIAQNLQVKLDGLPADVPAAQYNEAAARIEAISAAYRKQKKTLEWLLHGLSWARPWIVGLAPWGPVGLASGYVLLMGYVVYSGGDYVDWQRTGEMAWLDRVPGVRGTVEAMVSSVGA